MENQRTDIASVLDRARGGDREAGEQLVHWLYPSVMQVVVRRRPRGMDAEDVAQEVFLKLFANLSRFRGGAEALQAWSRRVAFRTCVSYFRRQRHRPELRWADLSEEQAELLEQVVLQGEAPDPREGIAARDLLERLMDELDTKDRLVIELLELEQRSPEEIQRRTGWSKVNIRVRAFRARRKLRASLEKLLRSDESN